MTESQLKQLFVTLGAPRPESWAESQIREGIPQLARYLVLRSMWDCVTPTKYTRWVDDDLKETTDQAYKKVVEDMLSAGISREAITLLVRHKQAETLREFCYVLEDYSSPPYNSDPATGDAYVRWSLRQLDEDGNPTGRPIDGLHESFWSVDPEAKK
jgi:hypothetical protein